MITLSLLKLLEANNLGRANLTGSLTGTDLLYHEKLPDGKTGVYILSGGSSLDRNKRTNQEFDLYARGTNDLQGAQWLEKILKFFTTDCYPVCNLPAVSGYTTENYKNCTITPVSNVRNVGLDSTNRLIYVATCKINYSIKEN